MVAGAKEDIPNEYAYAHALTTRGYNIRDDYIAWVYLKMEAEAEVNESVVENVSNVTGREAATPQGIAITYSSLFLMALVPLLVGSLRSVGYHAGLRV